MIDIRKMHELESFIIHRKNSSIGKRSGDTGVFLKRCVFKSVFFV